MFCVQYHREGVHITKTRELVLTINAIKRCMIILMLYQRLVSDTRTTHEIFMLLHIVIIGLLCQTKYILFYVPQQYAIMKIVIATMFANKCMCMKSIFLLL